MHAVWMSALLRSSAIAALAQLDAEKGERSSYAKSTIVAASAPRELGSLRQADGAEGFEK